ncbi:glutamate--tRNA ligase [Holospora obtusa]|nr:glutamate--tRNA ligase family protein [Holospora obtusa]
MLDNLFLNSYPKVRFAPSPTGFLHLGNVRIALFNWMFARKYEGIFILRIDDTDKARCNHFYVESLKKDLKWLGIDWDICFAQSDRGEFYAPYIDELKRIGRLYPCCETAEELEAQREKLRLNHQAPVFDRQTRLIDYTRTKHWRFALKKEKTFWQDQLQGECYYDTHHVSDPVVIREDGSLSYLLTSVLDDQDPQHSITHVIRGIDHYVNTAIQCQMFEALKKTCPVFAHLPLLQQETGEKFSKRTKGNSVRDWRSEGVFPESICQVLLNLSCENIELIKTFKERVYDFSWKTYAKAAEIRLNLETIWSASNRYFSQISWEDLQYYLSDFPCKNLKKMHWECIAKNVYSFFDIQAWDQIFDTEWYTCQENTENFFSDLLKNSEYLDAVYFQWEASLIKIKTSSTEMSWSGLWKDWTKSLSQKFSLKYFEVCGSLRWIITGKLKGPPMVEILSLLEKQSLEYRLKSFVNKKF